MTNPRVEDARDQAFLAAGVSATDRPTAETEFNSVYNRGLGGEEAVKRSLRTVGATDEQIAAGARRFNEAYNAHEAISRSKWRRWRRIAIAAIAAVVILVVVVVVANLAAPDAPSSAPTATSVPTSVPGKYYAPEPDGSPVPAEP